MTHDSAAVAAYVAGELTGTPHDEFENHLLACEACWDEVEAGRRGRRLAELTREPAPAPLRARIAAELAGATRRRRRTSRLVAAGLAACVAVLGAIAVATLPNTRPAPVHAAVQEFRAERLPGAGIPATEAPDLTSLGFTQAAAGAGELGGVPVTAYAYRDATGRRLLIYVGRRSFATPGDAKHYEGGSAWILQEQGVTVLCSRTPHTTLVVGQDEEQVADAAEFLHLA